MDREPAPVVVRAIVLAAVLALPALVLLTGLEFLPYLLIPALMTVPAIVFGDRTRPPDPPEDDGGGGSDRPHSRPPVSPLGGLPLSDAAPARRRLRDHTRGNRPSPSRRRGTRHPARRPTRLPQ